MSDCFRHNWHHRMECPQCDAEQLTAGVVPIAKGVIAACVLVLIVILVVALC